MKIRSTLAAMTLPARIIERAKENPQRIVFPEGSDPRILQAAHKISQSGLGYPTLIGHPSNIEGTARSLSLTPDCKIINPSKSSNLEELATILYERRRARGMRYREALKLAQDPLYFSSLLVAQGEYDGCVAGAITPTGTTVRAALQCVGLRSDRSILSSFFIMIIPDSISGENGALIYADCAVVPQPTPAQLAEIAIASAANTSLYLQTEPRIALLSFSTSGSSSHPVANRIIEAVTTAKARAPHLLIDGELQIDAALVPEVAKLKSPTSPLKGHANTLIFPSLEAGNIAYKLTERLAGARAIGPIFQGLKKPINDLSRGCSVEDIILVTAVTALQSQALLSEREV